MQERLSEEKPRARRARAMLAASFTLAAAVAGAASSAALAAIAAPGCGSTSEAPAADAGYTDHTTTTLHPDAAPLPGQTECKVVIETGIDVPHRAHVPVCTPVEYATNPPSGGDHWPIWATFTEFSTPVPREVYVHDLEHGAVVLAYRCDAACPDVVAALHEARAGAAADPVCEGEPEKARVVLTPDPELDAPIAAAAWGATYVATCIDPASLAAFVADAYGRGPEVECATGSYTGMDGSPPCADAGAD